MGFDWDGVVNANVMPVFAEGGPLDQAGAANLPKYYPGGVLSAGFDLYDAVFDDGSKQVSMLGMETSIQTDEPTLGVRQALFPAGVEPAADDLVDIPSKGVRYVVKVAQPDGKGHVLLGLNFVQRLAST